MSDTDQPSRITVSRDALRADLTEMELRLRIYFDEQLKHKADASTVLALQLVSAAIERGDFSPSHKRAIDERVEQIITERGDRAWSRREQMFAVISGSTAVGMLILSAMLAARGVFG